LQTRSYLWIAIPIVLVIVVVSILTVALPHLSGTLVPLLTAPIGIGGILIAQLLTNVREQGQRISAEKLKDKELAHAENMKDKDLEEARQTRLRDDRIKAYTEFLRLAIGRYTTDPSVTTELVGTYSSILLFAGNSETKEAAIDLYRRAVDLRKLAHKVDWEEERTEEGETISRSTDNLEYNVADKAVGDAALKFINAARVDIGHSPDVSEPPLRLEEYGD
jgi:hypothetical protein